MSKKGGYVIVDLKGQSITAGTPFTLDGVTARLNRAKNKACLLSGFAIGDEEKRDVFVDLQKTEDGYVALFGQYTITIEDDEVTITDGGILLDNIVDSQGHKRFVEIDGVTTLPEGVESVYAKCSLSGTHLMFVLAGKVNSGVTIPANTDICHFNLPQWIYDKIKPVWSYNIEAKSITYRDDAWAVSVNQTITLGIDSNSVFMRATNEVAATAVLGFRIQFDLLIDTVDAE